MYLPDWEVDHVVDLVPPDEAPEGEAFELDDQNVGQTPQQQLLGGLAVLLALWTVPESETAAIKTSSGGESTANNPSQITHAAEFHFRGTFQQQ